MGDGCWVPADSGSERRCRPPTRRRGPAASQWRTTVVRGSIESEIDPTGRAAVAEAHCHAIVTRIKKNVGQHSRRIGPHDFDVDLLPWRIAVQEKSGYESRPCAALNLRPQIARARKGERMRRLLTGMAAVLFRQCRSTSRPPSLLWTRPSRANVGQVALERFDTARECRGRLSHGVCFDNGWARYRHAEKISALPSARHPGSRAAKTQGESSIRYLVPPYPLSRRELSPSDVRLRNTLGEVRGSSRREGLDGFDETLERHTKCPTTRWTAAGGGIGADRSGGRRSRSQACRCRRNQPPRRIKEALIRRRNCKALRASSGASTNCVESPQYRFQL